MKFEQQYFIHSKRSNYEDYRKKKFKALAQDLISNLRLNPNTSVLDFGCATGGLLFELKQLGITNIKGTDISYWAIDYGKRYYGLHKEMEYMNINLLTQPFDVVFFLDVLEHVPTVFELERFFQLLSSKTVVVRLPVSEQEGKPFVLEVSRNDTTHVQCHSKQWWADLFDRHGYLFHPLNAGHIYDSHGVMAGVLTHD
jgi:cyclopropane fatty-acyl-phospholipid synthase-like methyltransferase